IRTPPSPSYFFFLLLRPPPTSTLFPYTTLFRSRSAHDGAGDRDPLTLPAGESHAAVADDRVVPVGELRDEGVGVGDLGGPDDLRSEEHTSELQSRSDLVCRLLLEKKKKKQKLQK